MKPQPSDLHLAAVEFDYSIIEAIYSGEVSRHILGFIHQEIDDEDVYEDEEQSIKGKEDKPHITILYGIKEPDPDVPKISQVIQNHPAMNRVNWLGLAKFTAETHDVLVIKIESPEAHELFRDFNNIFPDNANSFPNFIPHTTLAYLQKGKADKYIEQFGEAFIEEAVDIEHIRFAFNEETTNFDPATGEIQHS
jgi:2'-5' RNA ligase